MNQGEPEELLGVRAAARRLGVHENTVRNWADAGLLAPVRMPAVMPARAGSHYRRFLARDIEQLREVVAAGRLEQLAQSATAITTGELAALLTVARMYLDVFLGSNQMAPSRQQLYRDVEDIVERYGKRC